MKITIGSDHAGVELKEEVKMILKEFGDVEVTDVGTFNVEPVDYPDIAEKVCENILNGKSERGILICGTGLGIGMAANKIKGIRCAVCRDVYEAKMSRSHNDANVLALGSRVIGFGTAAEIVRAWFTTNFSGGRHEGRVKKMMALEK